MKDYDLMFKPAFAITITLLCFAFFFVKGVDNGIMVLATLAVKHYFDSTASSVQKNNTVDKMADIVKTQQEKSQ